MDLNARMDSLSGTLRVGLLAGAISEANLRSLLWHEFGHDISFFLKSNLASQKSQGHYEKVRECLDRNHQNAQGKYKEEDFADMWSLKMPLRYQPHQFFCIILKDENQPLNEITIKNENLGDPHSSIFFRILYFIKIEMEGFRIAAIDILKMKEYIKRLIGLLSLVFYREPERSI